MPDILLVVAIILVGIDNLLLSLPGPQYVSADLTSTFLTPWSSFALGAGTATCMVRWLEYCSLLPNKRIVLAIACAYVINSLITMGVNGCLNLIPTMSPQQTILSTVILTAMALASLALNTRVHSNQTISAHLARHPRTLPRRLRDAVPPDIIAWVLAIGIALGIMEGAYPGALIGNLTDEIGRAIPCLVVIIFYFFAPNHFDSRYFFGITLPLVVIALALINYENIDITVAHLFFSMGAVVARLLTYSLVCMRASQLRISSLLGCLVVMLLNVTSHMIANIGLAHLAPFAGNSPLTLIVIGMASVTIVLLLIHESDWLAHIDETPDAHVGIPSASADRQALSESGRAVLGLEESDFERLRGLAAAKNLTPRETTVFYHMAIGETNVEIGDHLFISTGAVRSHTSRIYEKLGVHSRKEFDEIIGQ